MRKDVCLLVGCSLWAMFGVSVDSRVSARTPGEPVRVTVSIPPQAFLVKQIGGEFVSVAVLLPPGQSHETYEPTPQAMTRVSEAELFCKIGVPFETRLLSKIGGELKNVRTVDTWEGITFLAMTHAHEHASPESAAGHQAAASDPHIWLDPNLMKIQAANICAGLVDIDSSHKEVYQQNLRTLQHLLDETDRNIRDLLTPFHGRAFYVFHPAFGYFADAYGLRQEAIEVEGKEPTARQLADLIEQAARDSVRAVFVQPQFPKKQVAVVAGALNAEVVILDPLAEDYLSNLRDIAGKIAASFGREGTVAR
jgi:zinc transport system substrate-binding protein